MKLICLLLAIISTSVHAGNQLPIEAMKVLGSLRGNYQPANCVEKNIKNGVEQKAFACNANLTQIWYSHIDGVLHTYFFKNGDPQAQNLVYGRMVYVGQIGCREMDGINSKECFDVKPGYFAENVDYSFPMQCGEQEVVNSTKLHWELKKTPNGVQMLVHEDIFYNICNEEEGKLEEPMVMTKDLTVDLNSIK